MERTYLGKECIHGHGRKRYIRNSECVECRNEYKKRKRAESPPKKIGRPRKNPESVQSYKRRWPKYPEPASSFDFWALRIKRANKERRKISYEQMLSLKTDRCPLLGIEITYDLYAGQIVPDNYATLDKIDPNKGYVMGNIQILSHRANTLKNNSTIEELELLLRNWKKIQQSIFSENESENDENLR